MSSSRIFHSILMGGESHLLLPLSRIKSKERLLRPDGRLTENPHCCKRYLYSQTGQQYSSLPQDDSLPKTRRSLLNKIKSSQKQFRIVSLPNIVTASRALMAPAMGYFIMNNMHSHALVCCAYAAISDVADKFIANLTNQASPLNTTLDALADKLLIVTSCIALYKTGIMPIFFIKSVVVRDVIIVGGGATIRYHGFEDRPTLKKYLDIDHYPTFCFKVNFLNRFVTGLQYSVIMAHLGFNHLTGGPTYDWAIFLWQGFAVTMSSISIAWYMTTWFKPTFLCKLPKR